MAKDRDIIYLETDEEIPTIISRLDDINGAEAIFVVPKEAILTHSLINLKLLKREADKRKKTISIVTSDESGINLSKKAGFTVFDSVNGARAYEGISSVSEEDEDKVFAEEEKVVQKDDISEDVPTKQNFAKKPIDSTQEKVLQNNEVSSSDNYETRSKPPKGRVYAGPVFKFDRRKTKIILIILSGLAFIGLGIFLYLYLPSAKINLYLKAESKDTQMSFVVAQKAGAGELASQIIETDKEKSSQSQATGQKEIGAKASGSITIYNYWDSAEQVLVAGTRFQAISSNRIFKTIGQITVPGTRIEQGQQVPGSITAGVEADEIGAEYNIAPDRFIIPGLATDKQSKIYGESSQPMTGGVKKTVRVVSEEDCTKSLNTLKDSLQKDAQKDLNTKTEAFKDYIFNSNLVFSEAIEEKCDPGIDTEASAFTTKVKLHYVAFLYQNNDLKNLLKTQALKNIDPNKDVATEAFSKLDFTEKKADLKNKRAEVKVNTNLVIVPKLDLAKIKTNILGKDRDSAIKYLNSVSEIQKSEIQLFPSFIKRISKNPKRVIIETKEAK